MLVLFPEDEEELQHRARRYYVTKTQPPRGYVTHSRTRPGWTSSARGRRPLPAFPGLHAAHRGLNLAVKRPPEVQGLRLGDSTAQPVPTRPDPGHMPGQVAPK